MSKKLRISLIFGNLVVAKLLNTNPRMHNLYTKFAKILEICKQLSDKLVRSKLRKECNLLEMSIG